jgi:hypothetical protein
MSNPLVSPRAARLHLVSESPELRALTEHGNAIKAYQQSARAASPSSNLPLDPVG